MSQRKPYVRPMEGWWRRNSYYGRYMLMELTSVAVAVYAVLLLVGVWRLSQGQEQFEAWQAALRQPLSIIFHCIMFASMCYHAYTWWKVLPKTLPLIHAGGKPVPGLALSAVGWMATVAVSVAVYTFVRWCGI
jgi:fumarate reductase subunit C